MSRSVSDARQVVIRRFLDQLADKTDFDGTSDAKPASTTELDNLLDSLDSEATSPLRMSASATPDLTVSVGAAVVVNPENNRTRSIPHISSLLPNSFSSGTVVFPATSGGTITVTPGTNGTLTVTSNNYINVLIYMDSNGDLNVSSGVENAVEANATVPAAPIGTLAIGYVTMFNNAGTVDNVEQDKIYQIVSGSSKLENVVEDTTPQLGGNLDTNGNAVLHDTNGLKRGNVSTPSNLVEEEYIDNISLSGSQTDTVITELTFAHASFEGFEMVFKIKESTSNDVEIGTFRVVTNGTDIVYSNLSMETNPTGITFDAVISGSDVNVRYSSGANGGTLRADVKRFRA